MARNVCRPEVDGAIARQQSAIVRALPVFKFIQSGELYKKSRHYAFQIYTIWRIV